MATISNLTAKFSKPVDRYWENMGVMAVEALSEVLHPDLTPHRRKLIAEYLAGIMDNAYNMGIKLGELNAKLKRDD